MSPGTPTRAAAMETRIVVESILATVQVIIVETLRKTQNTLSLLECTLDLFPLASPNVRFTSLVGHEHQHDIMASKSTLKKKGQKKKI